MKSQLTVCCLKRIVPFSRRRLDTFKDQFKMVGKTFYLCVDLRLWWEYHPMITDKNRPFGYRFHGLANDLDTLENFFITDHQPVVDITFGTDRNLKIEGFVIIIRGILSQIERIADYSLNIAESIFFLVEGRLVKHTKRFWDQEITTEKKQDISNEKNQASTDGKNLPSEG